MFPQRVDYDRIAATYDRRYEVDRLGGTATALGALAQEVDAKRILEVGCGTGRWLADLQSISSHLVGLDFSGGMLKRAKERDREFLLVRGRACQLSFADRVFDFVFCVNAIHHFDDPRGFVGEARRLLNPNGAFVIVGSDPSSRRDQWYVYDYFEGTYEADLARFPPRETILGWMMEAGFERAEWRVVERIVDSKVGREVLEDPFLQKDAVSQLALLDDEAYAAGMRRIEMALAEAEALGKTAVFQTELDLRMIVGWVGE